MWRRNALVWRKLAVGSLIGNFGEPLLYLLALGYGLGALIDEIDGMPYLHFLASGIVCSSAMMTASFEGTYSAFSRMAVQRTWDGVTTAPLSVADVVSAEIIWAASKALLSASAILLVAALMAIVSGPRALLALPVLFLSGITFGALALAITAIARSYDFFLFYTTLFITPLLLLSGVFFPLNQVPSAVQVLAAVMPLSHVVALVRPLVVGQSVNAPITHLAVLVCYAAVAWITAIYLAQRRLRA
ncbi:MAG: lipooligosaccharide transport system permease protein [Gammaproteobacteria bacterium]|jgi:lipooligosaccharide transport system permease protein